MMDLVARLAERAGALDKAMGALANREGAAEAKREALGSLRDELERMASDGWLDPQELATLASAMARQGVDMTALARRGPGGMAADRGLLDALSDAIGAAEASTEDGRFGFEAQMLLAEHHEVLETASRVSKTEHDAYMSVIRHLAG